MDINFKTKKIADTLGIEAVYLEEEIERLIRNKGVSNEKFIFIDFSKAFENTNPDDLRMDQFEIALQILLNRGYQLSIYNDDYEKHHFFENFVENFKDARIEYLKFTNEKELIEKIMFAGLMITFHKERLFYPFLLENKFLYIARGDLDANSNYLENTYLKIDDGFQAGKLVEKIKSIIESEGFFIEEMEVLRSDLNVDLDQTGTSLNSLEECQVLFKQNIKELIEKGLLEEVKPLILEYEEIASQDLELYAIKGIMAIKEGELEQARFFLEKGLELKNEDYELNYAMGYLYECMGACGKAMEHYKVSANSKRTQEVGEYNRTEEEQAEIVIVDNKNYNEKVLDTLDLYTRRSNMSSLLLRDREVEVTVYVIAYNKLEEYTKPCIDSLIKYTNNIDYNLVLVDNGSTDGTLEYFKKIDFPRKKIIRVEHNIGSVYGVQLGYLNCETKYFSVVTNDMILTPNWLLNLLICMKSDEHIGIASPGADFISNYQSIDLGYKNKMDMIEKARFYNVSNPMLWEERLRIITLGTLFRKECIDVMGYVDYGFRHDFTDDDIAFRARRAGYKVIFCRDTFISHAGGIDFSVNSEKIQDMNEGKLQFKKKHFGVDAWEDTKMEIEFLDLFAKHLKISSFSEESVKILGIQSKCGATILQAKNILNNIGVSNVELNAIENQPKYWIDLKTICTGTVCILNDFSEIGQTLNDEYNYIFIDQQIDAFEEPKSLFDNLKKLGDKNTRYYIKIRNDKDLFFYAEQVNLKIEGGVNSHNRKFSVQDLKDILNEEGYFVESEKYSEFNLDEMSKKLLEERFIGDAPKLETLLHEYYFYEIRKKG